MEQLSLFEQTEKTRTGRNTRLVERRNRILIARYYYWSEIKRRRFDDVLEILQEQEVFITERTIYEALKDNAYLDELMETKPTAEQLQEEYPSFNFTL